MRLIVTHTACLYISLLVTSVSRAKTDKPIEMPFGAVDSSPRYRALGGTRVPTEKGTFGVTLRHVQIRLRSIFSTLFARGQQRCDLWL